MHDFADFVGTRSTRLLRVAYLLTRDWPLAEDLLQTALAKAWTAWRRIDGDPEAYVRKILVNTYASWWRRRWQAETPVSEVPEPSFHAPEPTDDRRTLMAALGRLPRQQRAVIVLRYYEDLSEREIAEILRISPGTVKSHAAKALANLRTDPALLAFDPVAPAGLPRTAGVADRIRRNQTRKVTAAAAALALLMAFIIGYATAGHRPAPRPATPSPSQVPEEGTGSPVAPGVTLSTDLPVVQWRVPAARSDITYMIRCVSGSAAVEFAIEGHRLGFANCSNESTAYVRPDPEQVRALPDVENATLVLQLTGGAFSDMSNGVPHGQVFVEARTDMWWHSMTEYPAEILSPAAPVRSVPPGRWVVHIAPGHAYWVNISVAERSIVRCLGSVPYSACTVPFDVNSLAGAELRAEPAQDGNEHDWGVWLTPR
ncbi:SigE family RNA polymerase sigma factor [Hamadaea tsunoensis]|uniref:SigE family RNA polymerase sigma factor n=1 Tax=Hamadaea tsunoensis TaxID=53368 RepID=UPI0004182C55|nr:SigE family RNA polymerase sigma factor [Hamadaea tsunoensis]